MTKPTKETAQAVASAWINSKDHIRNATLDEIVAMVRERIGELDKAKVPQYVEALDDISDAIEAMKR